MSKFEQDHSPGGGLDQSGVEEGTSHTSDTEPPFFKQLLQATAGYFSGLFSASVTDGDAPDTQDLVGFGENWNEKDKKLSFR